MSFLLNPFRVGGGGGVFATFFDVVDTGWTEQLDNDLEATSVNYTTGTRFLRDLTQIGDYIEYIEGANYGIVVDNPNGNLLALGLNDTIYSHAGGYGNNPATTVTGYTTTPGNVMRWEIIDSGGGVPKIRLKNITLGTTQYTSSFNLDLTGDRVEIRFTAYGDAIATVFPKPVIVSGGVTY